MKGFPSIITKSIKRHNGTRRKNHIIFDEKRTITPHNHASLLLQRYVTTSFSSDPSNSMTSKERQPSIHVYLQPPVSTKSEVTSDNEKAKNAPSCLLTEDEIKKALEAAERAKKAEEMWDTFVPDRKLGLQSPAFWVLLVLCVALHIYNNEQEKTRDGKESADEVIERNLRKEAEEKQKQRIAMQQEQKSALQENRGNEYV